MLAISAFAMLVTRDNVATNATKQTDFIAFPVQVTPHLLSGTVWMGQKCDRGHHRRTFRAAKFCKPGTIDEASFATFSHWVGFTDRLLVKREKRAAHASTRTPTRAKIQ